jgi:hypothetical protein
MAKPEAFVTLGTSLELFRVLSSLIRVSSSSGNHRSSRRKDGRSLDRRASEGWRRQETEAEDWILERLCPKKDKEEVSENGGKNDEQKREEERDRDGGQ